MPRTPAPKTYRTEIELKRSDDMNGELIEAVDAVARPILVIEFVGMDLWEIREACQEIEAKTGAHINKPEPVK